MKLGETYVGSIDHGDRIYIDKRDLQNLISTVLWAQPQFKRTPEDVLKFLYDSLELFGKGKETK